MSLYPLTFYRTVGDLWSYASAKNPQVTVSELRKSIPIAVIDDEPLAAEANLRSHGYDIKQIGDIKNVEEVKNFSIVLCDLMGVGQYFDPLNQGASLIEEIKLNYPAVVVVAYSGSSLNSGPARAARKYADRTLRKDADISEWRRMLDELVQKAADPLFIWHRIRVRLTEMEMDTKAILLLEDAYVRTILQKDQSAKRLKDAISSASVGNDVRGIAQGLIATALFTMLSA